ncbi:hypothetical protein ACH4YO_40725 [Streptomyces noursei]|uniref:hypothetical protein n=1 Tax=Streptomyces noursei TaxID=1971 RepID=UPI00081C4F13|nr:hypothetical protein SNOUR_00005 [Streptomyces noursei ATCC 11455]ANZ22011.1 hypothetical protein SNOUR_43945 [Streptomyces noursei ATCC 11455]MCZ0991845.1 hypothetical protein [Streptomyces noursei]
MPDVQVTEDTVIVTYGSAREVFEIVSKRITGTGRVITMPVVDDEGRLWITAWIQVLPSVMEAYAWAETNHALAVPAPNEDAATTARPGGVTRDREAAGTHTVVPFRRGVGARAA